MAAIGAILSRILDGFTSVGTELKKTAYLAKANVFTVDQTFGSGNVIMGNATSNLLDFIAAGLSLPSNGLVPPAGQKITLYKNRGASDGDYSIGVNANELWVSLGSGTNRTFVVRVNYTNRFQVSNTGASVTGTFNVTGSSTISGTLTATLGLVSSANLVVAGQSKLGNYRLVAAATYDWTTADKYLEVQTSGCVVTLPTATQGYDYYIINTSTGAITVQGRTAAQTIGNTSAATQSIQVAAGAALHVVASGNTGLWRVI